MDSLFYVKTKISEDCEINTSITEKNVYFRCARCGAEEQVDLTQWTDFIDESDINAFGISVYCSECSAKVASKVEE